MNADANRGKAIFLDALEKHDPDGWPAFLDEACADQPELRRRVEVLLKAHREASTAQGRPSTEGSHSADGGCPTERPGSVIGPYKLLEQIGEGGMGTVFVAEQTEPVKRQVALKLVRAGMDSAQVLARFEQERQALALMDHPNIARVLDAGTTASGRPYFVMELVLGLTITRYCDEHKLTPRERLELFIPVCQAVQHAHQKGIIHRDLKPSNVLVCLYDGKPVPKVIDFGVAKATGPRLMERTLFTEFGTVVGTLEYMSPEQAELNQPDIDTRSDIYSLGVFLYELLTGTTPLERKRQKEKSLLELLRVIREEEPPTPSTRLRTAEELLRIAANRGLEPRKLRRLVYGELDWVVMRALEKDRSRRYQTANAFAADVQRYLSDKPVQACPPSKWYHFRKFVWRNLGTVVAAVLVLATLVGGILGTTLSLVQAERARDEEARQRRTAEENERKANNAAKAEKCERERADRNVELGVEALEAIYRSLEHRLPSEPRLEEQDRDLLARLLEFYHRFATRNSDNPTVKPRVGHGFLRVGLIQEKLGQVTAAEKAFDRAISLYKELAAESPGKPDYQMALARGYQSLGNLLLASDRLAEAGKTYAEVQRILDKLEASCRGKPEYRQALATLHSNQVRLLLQQSESRTMPLVRQKAESHCREALAILEGLAKEYPEHRGFERELASLHNMLGAVLRHANQFQQAKENYERALHLQEKWSSRFPADQNMTAELGTTHRNMGILLRSARQLPAAEKAYRRAVAEFERLVADSPNVPHNHSELGEAIQGLAATIVPDQPEGARDLLKRALHHQRMALRQLADSPKYRRKLRNHLAHLALALADLRQHEEASEAASELGRLAERPIDYETALHLQLACIGLADLDSGLAREKRAEHVKRYGDRAMEVLRETITKRFFTAEHVKRFPDLDLLRSREDARRVLDELQKHAR